MTNPKEIKLHEDFDVAITNQLVAPMSDSDLQSEGINPETPTFEVYEDNESPLQCLPEVDKVTPEDANYYIGAEVGLPIGGNLLCSTVKCCTRDIDGNLTGKANMNPILDSRTYKVEFPDGRTAEFSANTIAEHMFTQCNPTRNQYLQLDSIIDHKIEDSAVKDSD